jgi:peptidyl-tRNA hydrolase, PTH1 family
VKAFADYFKISSDDILVLVDDMALEPGRFRLREGGSSGGQKGLQNIIDLLKTDKIKRIRIGTGEPENKNVVDYVLGIPSGEELSRINAALDEALMAVKYYLASSDWQKTMTKFNTNKVLGQ